MDKNEILNSDCDVRVSVARNPNTPVDVLMELARIATLLYAVEWHVIPTPPSMCSLNWKRTATGLSAVMQHVIPICPSMCSQN